MGGRLWVTVSKIPFSVDPCSVDGDSEEGGGDGSSVVEEEEGSAGLPQGLRHDLPAAALMDSHTLAQNAVRETNAGLEDLQKQLAALMGT